MIRVLIKKKQSYIWTHPPLATLGTHRGGKSLPEAQEAGQAPSLVAAEMEKGSVLLFDYRLWHRGLPNRQSATDRHMLYLVVAKPWWRDHKNHLCGAPRTR